ncbi:Vacuolar sorting protein 9 [Plasmopara halstedii]|uniref:Vacuolar sorting protein 9 n=1 Tax=Plasmopara halstedii TaxID=4781 RepID=A0A0P1B128_PLAHL|nr:Vacuolar sorting protein 9 [Plasmopara halstedii]CEG47230.1 Vacuolar sorting protein 9 [Plasmopara halstedii]|eukprot:XP_024583599.1 Vacuolar sorting protein 9 [Plasmopara halstedii]
MGLEDLSVLAANLAAERVVDAKGVATATSPIAAASPIETEAAAMRRRTSIPSTFSFGGIDHAIPTSDIGQRRWRSFDAALSENTAASSALDQLTRRIQEESQHVLKRKARLSKRRELLRSVKGWISSSRRDQVALLQMQLVAEVATSNRSLAVLGDMRTLLELDEADDLASGTQRHRSSFAASQTLLDGIEQSDRALAEDWLRQVLQLQANYLAKLMKLHRQKNLEPNGLTLQQLLDQVVSVTSYKDEPTPALVRFEKLLSRQKLLKPDLKRALDKLCLDTMRSFTRSCSQPGPKTVFDEREARDVMNSLVEEIVNAVAAEAKLEQTQLPALRMFVEHMVFCRLACACYRDTEADLDELNASWREQAAKMRELSLDEIGVPVKIPEEVKHQEIFSESIAAFNKIPHLVPSSVLSSMMRAVCTLYRESKNGLGLDSSCISADVLLPLLVYVLSRSELPHLHSQVYLMEQYAIDESQDGSEAAYYLACLQAAMCYIMGN